VFEPQHADSVVRMRSVLIMDLMPEGCNPPLELLAGELQAWWQE